MKKNHKTSAPQNQKPPRSKRKNNNIQGMEHNPIGTGKSREFLNSPLQILLFLGALIFLCMMLGSAIIALACNMQGIDFQTTITGFGPNASPELRNFMRGALLINHMLTFLVPAMLTGYVFYRKDWSSELGLLHAPSPKKLGLGILMVAASFPLAQLAFAANSWLVGKVGFLASLVPSESASEQLMEGLLVMQSPLELIFSLTVMAAVPAIGEEMVFRGILQKQLQRLMTNPYSAILVTALIFSLAHFQVQRFLAIFLLGAVLGLVFYWTKRLWIPIAGHFIFNGTQVVAAYFNQENLDNLNAGDETQMPIWVGIISLAAVVFIAQKLIKLRDR